MSGESFNGKPQAPARRFFVVVDAASMLRHANSTRATCRSLDPCVKWRHV
jgi:hypothetical protein